MSMKEVRLVVSAPPDNWAWGKDMHQLLSDLPDMVLAKPTEAKDRRGKHWRYTKEESDAIWSYSEPFRGEET